MNPNAPRSRNAKDHTHSEDLPIRSLSDLGYELVVLHVAVLPVPGPSEGIACDL